MPRAVELDDHVRGVAVVLDQGQQGVSVTITLAGAPAPPQGMPSSVKIGGLTGRKITRNALAVKAVFLVLAALGYSPMWLAILADTTRAQQLARIATPTLVIHGSDDTLVPLAAGQDTARRIPGARLAVVEGMGHDLPPGVVDRVLAPLLPHLAAHSLQTPLS